MRTSGLPRMLKSSREVGFTYRQGRATFEDGRHRDPLAHSQLGRTRFIRLRSPVTAGVGYADFWSA